MLKDALLLALGVTVIVPAWGGIICELAGGWGGCGGRPGAGRYRELGKGT